jgi:hypothetical protein
MELELQVRGHLEAGKRLDDMGKRAVHAQPAFRKVVDELLKGEQAIWRGRGWKPLAESTIRRKRAEGLDPRPLRATGALEKSLTQRLAPHAIREIHDDELRFGSSHVGAIFTQRGTKTEKKTLRQPKRQVLRIRAPERKSIRGIILSHLMGDDA